jgi:DNA-directed RNA polymerase subunit F
MSFNPEKINLVKSELEEIHGRGETITAKTLAETCQKIGLEFNAEVLQTLMTNFEPAADGAPGGIRETLEKIIDGCRVRAEEISADLETGKDGALILFELFRQMEAAKTSGVKENIAAIRKKMAEQIQALGKVINEIKSPEIARLSEFFEDENSPELPTAPTKYEKLLAQSFEKNPDYFQSEKYRDEKEFLAQLFNNALEDENSGLAKLTP